jgi:hypothetical protein
MIGHYLLPIQDVLNQRSLAVQERERDTRNLIVRCSVRVCRCGGGWHVCLRDGLVCLSWSSIVGIKRHSKIVDFVFCFEGIAEYSVILENFGFGEMVCSRRPSCVSSVSQNKLWPTVLDLFSHNPATQNWSIFNDSLC